MHLTQLQLADERIELLQMQRIFRDALIREGLQDGDGFEQAQVLLGEHLGFSAGKRESDASPDPWWIVGDIALVFEDHANAQGDTAVIDATKARQGCKIRLLRC